MTTVTVSVTALSMVVAVPLICVGLALDWASPRNHVARLTGAALVASGWLVFGIGQAAAHKWWVVPGDALLALAGVLRVLAVIRAIRRGQP